MLHLSKRVFSYQFIFNDDVRRSHDRCCRHCKIWSPLTKALVTSASIADIRKPWHGKSHSFILVERSMFCKLFQWSESPRFLNLIGDCCGKSTLRKWYFLLSVSTTFHLHTVLRIYIRTMWLRQRLHQQQTASLAMQGLPWIPHKPRCQNIKTDILPTKLPSW